MKSLCTDSNRIQYSLDGDLAFFRLHGELDSRESGLSA